MNFTEWLMDILKAVYTGEWGDRGGVTEGLIQHWPPCQTLTTPSLFGECLLSPMHRPCSRRRGNSHEQGRQEACLQGASTLPSLQGSSCASLLPPQPHLLPLPTSQTTHNSGCSFLPLYLCCYLFLKRPHSPSPTGRSPWSPAEVLILVNSWPSTWGELATSLLPPPRYPP